LFVFTLFPRIVCLPVSGRVLTVAHDRIDPQTINRGFYKDSITQKAEQRKGHFSTQHLSYQSEDYRFHANELPLPSQTLGSNAFTHGKRVGGVNFEMWMSPNQNNMNKRLHDFTSLQTARDLPRCDPSPLENVRDWRSSYPCLASTLDGKGDISEFDIIMIETSYKMMSEFPPPKATLGLRLELDFGQKSHGEFFDWTCTTHIYRNGVAVKLASYYRLEAKWGMVTPPFDSMWWALTFIDKIEQKKQAEETGKRDDYHAAQERIHKFFSQLTAVHEIRARSRSESGFQDARSERGLVAVLLWKFSIAPEAYVGTTSWQRLLPPPARITTNSPCPNQQEMSLPPLAMDTIVDGLHQLSELNDNKELLNGQPIVHYDNYHADIDDPNALLLSHHDFNLAFKEGDMANFASMQSSFMPSSHGDDEASNFHTLDHFDYDIQLHGLSTPSHHDVYQPTSTNIFETQHVSHNNISEQHQKQSQEQVYGLHELEHDVDSSTTDRHPLANFDHNIHNMLQAQLAESGQDQTKQERQEETLRAALAAASAMSDLGNPHIPIAHHHDHHHHHPSTQPEPKQESLSTLWEDIPSQRPHLHPHASFTSQASYTSHHEQEAMTKSDINSNAFDANHIPANLNGHDLDPTSSSPEIRRLLEMHNQSFAEVERQKSPVSNTSQGLELDSGLDGSFVVVDAENIEGDARE
jgi:hypothetical protein